MVDSWLVIGRPNKYCELVVKRLTSGLQAIEGGMCYQLVMHMSAAEGETSNTVKKLFGNCCGLAMTYNHGCKVASRNVKDKFCL